MAIIYVGKAKTSNMLPHFLPPASTAASGSFLACIVHPFYLPFWPRERNIHKPYYCNFPVAPPTPQFQGSAGERKARNQTKPNEIWKIALHLNKHLTWRATRQSGSGLGAARAASDGLVWGYIHISPIASVAPAFAAVCAPKFGHNEDCLRLKWTHVAQPLDSWALHRWMARQAQLMDTKKNCQFVI